MANYILAKKAVAVTLDANCPDSEGIIATVAGNVNVVMADPALPSNAGVAVTLPVSVGYNPYSVRRVNTAGTTATGLFLVY
jgi:hypothetical protein